MPGVFCTDCGASTARTDLRARQGYVARPFRLQSDDDPEVPLAPALPGPQDDPASRSYLRWETVLVMVAFLVPLVTAAVVLFAEHVAGVGGITRFPDFVRDQPVTNLVIGIVSYLSVLSIVPLALFLLARTGDTPSALGLGAPGLVSDLLPGLGIAVSSFLAEVVILIPLAPLLVHHKWLVSTVSVGHVPHYYVIWGLAISAITSVTEEVMMNGYLLTRLDRLGWSSGASTTLAVALRTSYHVYYGLGFLLTIPFAYFVTRSFQKHHRLTRTIAAHFIFDATLVTISILR